MKKKVILLIVIIIFILFAIGFSLTYARYKTDMEDKLINIEVAKFVFEDKYTNEIDLSLNSIKPGDELTTEFQVVNNKINESSQSVRSDVVIEYNIVLESQFNLPIELRLYKGTSTTATMTCTKSSATLSGGVYKCTTANAELNFSSDQTDSYKIKIKFPSDNGGTPWSSTYSGLNDYVKLYLNASQKM